MFFFSKIFEEAWLHIAHSMAVVSFYHLAIWHAFGIRLQRRKLEEQPHVGLGLVDAATLIELWIESLKTYWRLTSSTILLFYKLIFPIHRPSQSQLSTFKLRGNTSPAKLCRTLKRTPDWRFPEKKKTILNSLDNSSIKSVYTVEMKTFTVAMFNAY